MDEKKNTLFRKQTPQPFPFSTTTPASSGGQPRLARLGGVRRRYAPSPPLVLAELPEKNSSGPDFIGIKRFGLIVLHKKSGTKSFYVPT